ncbi:MAG TPA: ribosome maturation factor RimM [Bacteroidales bacterium]|nr:ribosome maturation factor RimM [Bacteroidales bacterium]
MKFQTTGPLGRILKSHGKQGELIISSHQDLPQDIDKMESLFIEIHEKVVPFFIEALRRKTPTTAVIKLEDIDTLEEANELAGSYWHLPSGLADKKSPEPLDEPAWLTGFILIDQKDRQIGTIEGVNDTTSNTLLEVRHQGEVVDVPVNEETIHYIDQENRILKNEVPEGLLDI